MVRYSLQEAAAAGSDGGGVLVPIVFSTCCNCAALYPKLYEEKDAMAIAKQRVRNVKDFRVLIKAAGLLLIVMMVAGITIFEGNKGMKVYDERQGQVFERW